MMTSSGCIFEREEAQARYHSNEQIENNMQLEK